MSDLLLSDANFTHSRRENVDTIRILQAQIEPEPIIGSNENGRK